MDPARIPAKARIQLEAKFFFKINSYDYHQVVKKRLQPCPQQVFNYLLGIAKAQQI
jgi:hypothetical protein